MVGGCPGGCHDKVGPVVSPCQFLPICRLIQDSHVLLCGGKTVVEPCLTARFAGSDGKTKKRAGRMLPGRAQ